MKIKQPKKYDGSLLGLFKSDFFNVHMLVEYLHKHRGTGTIDYLVNVFYKEDMEDIDFYMPQLCYLVLTRPNDETYSIRKFILDMSIKYSNLAFKNNLYLYSFSQDKGLLSPQATDF